MWRMILAALAGYVSVGTLVVLTDTLFASLIPGFSSMRTPPLYYFVASLVTDTLYSFAGGYICGRIARDRNRKATLLLLCFGEAIGIGAQVKLLDTVPLWFGLGLLLGYPLAVWYGAKFARQPQARAAATP